MAAIDQNKMQKTCRLIGAFALFVMVAIPLFLAAFWAQPIDSMLGTSHALEVLLADGLVSGGTISLGGKIIGFAFSAIPGAALFVAALYIRRLMQLFAAGSYITNLSVRYLRGIALSLMAFPPLAILSDTGFVLAMTMGNQPGQRLFSIGLGGEEVIAFLLGLLLWMITRAFEVEKERAEEHASIV